MNERATQLDGFLRAVHRRLRLLRVLESAGVGLALASAAGALLVGAAMWLGKDALELSCVILAVGAISGAACGLGRRSSAAAAAIEADRQLDLADLLATALAARQDAAADPWRRSVLAIAESRCRQLSPGDVVLARLGTRGWGGIGLSAAFVLTLGMLSTSPMRSDAGGRSQMQPPPRADAADAAGNGNFAARPLSSPAAGLSQARQAQPEERALSSPGNSSSEPATALNRESTNPPRTSPEQASSGSAARAGASDNPSPFDHPAAGRQITPEGLDRAGGGRAAAPRRGENANGVIAAPELPSPPTVPWKSPRWHSQREAAMQAVRTGGVPDGYRDVVREYFGGE